MSILVKPIITEKATTQSEVLNAYAFEVASGVNKIQIKEAVESKYGVTVEAVRTLNVRSDRKVKYTRAGLQVGKSKAIKKAIVKLAEGETIDIYSDL